MMSSTSERNAPPIRVENLTMAYGPNVIQRDLNFTVEKGQTCIIMGGSGCGKSTLMRHLVGLKPPAEGKVYVQGVSLWDASEAQRRALLRRIGVMYQAGALWSSMTLEENIALPLQRYSKLSPAEIRDMVALKLALVGLAGLEGYYPSEISGGMQKRASIARAMALDPDIVFFDEPSAGLDPITSRQIDELIIELRESLQTTFVVVTHELQSIFAIGTDSVFLDAQSKTMIAQGDPKRLLEKAENPRVVEFLTRGEQQGETRHGG
jgi:phospholipid/cholesterol/gamma-HCH transport system ATP-binding protein